MLSVPQRRRFDSLLDEVIADFPDELSRLLEEVPLVVIDEPSQDPASRSAMAELFMDPARSELCGLHWGVPLTKRSVEHSGGLPDQMMVFRGPIIRTSGRAREDLREQIRITVLHEIGHHFGLDEHDLEKLGYG